MKLVSLKYLILTFIFLNVFSLAWAQQPIETDAEVRLNPEISGEEGKADEPQAYIRRDLNHVILNGDNWDELKNKLEQSRRHANFTIVLVGDSHVQADGNTGTTRQLFQKEFGDAGRGVIIPFKIADTNEPRDYKITTNTPVTVGKILKRPWPVEMAFTGITVHPKKETYTFTVGVKDKIGYFTILSSGNPEVIEVKSGDRLIPFQTNETKSGVEVYLDEDCSDFTISLKGNDVNIFGFDLHNDNPGVVYHAVGNNGATYASYNLIPAFASSLAGLDPDLVIISLGTNEAFGNLNEDAFLSQVDKMVKNIRREIPNAKILLTTPSECQRSSGKGSSKSYRINDNVERIRDIIMNYAETNNVPVYDFYNVAGGKGSSDKWIADKLLSSDRIHRTWDGYKLDGTLMHEALREALTY